MGTNIGSYPAGAYDKTRLKVLNKVKTLKTNDLFKKSITNLIIQIAGLGLSYFVVFCISKYYNAATLGYYTLANIMLLLASMIVLMGTSAATVQMVPGYRVKNDQAALSSIFLKGTLHIIIVGIVVTGILYYSAPYIATEIMHKPELIFPYKINSLAIIPASLLSFYAEFLRGHGKTFLWALISKIFVFLIFIVLFMALAIFYKVPEPNVIYCIANFASIVIVIFILFSFLPKANVSLGIKNFNASPSYGEIRKRAFPMFLFTSTLLIGNWISTLMLGSLGTASDTGIFRVVDRVSSVGVLVLTAVNAVLTPKIAEAFAKGDLLLLRRSVMAATKMIFWASVPIQLAMLLFPAFILRLFGHEFSTGKEALIIATVGQVINSLTGPVSLILNMTKHQIFLRNASLIGLVLSVLFNWILIPRFGINGAAMASLCNTTYINVYGMYKVKKEFAFSTLYNPFSIFVKSRK